MKEDKKKLGFSKKLINDVRVLLWVITLGGLALAFYCVYNRYTSSLPWITSMVGLPWTAHATICAFYLNKSKAENTAADGTGIVFATAQANQFMQEYEQNRLKYKPVDCSPTYIEEEQEVIVDDYVNSPPI